jgi:hypothetical protein
LTPPTFDLIFAPGRLLLVSRSSWAPVFKGNQTEEHAMPMKKKAAKKKKKH